MSELDVCECDDDCVTAVTHRDRIRAPQFDTSADPDYMYDLNTSYRDDGELDGSQAVVENITYEAACAMRLMPKDEYSKDVADRVASLAELRCALVEEWRTQNTDRKKHLYERVRQITTWEQRFELINWLEEVELDENTGCFYSPNYSGNMLQLLGSARLLERLLYDICCMVPSFSLWQSRLWRCCCAQVNCYNPQHFTHIQSTRESLEKEILAPISSSKAIELLLQDEDDAADHDTQPCHLWRTSDRDWIGKLATSVANSFDFSQELPRRSQSHENDDQQSDFSSVTTPSAVSTPTMTLPTTAKRKFACFSFDGESTPQLCSEASSSGGFSDASVSESIYNALHQMKKHRKKHPNSLFQLPIVANV